MSLIDGGYSAARKFQYKRLLPIALKDHFLLEQLKTNIKLTALYPRSHGFNPHDDPG